MIPLRDTVPSSHFPAVTVGLIGVNALVFLLEITMSARGLDEFFHLWGIVPACYASSALPTWTSELKELGEYAVTPVQVWHTFSSKDRSSY